jgi:MFS family permease
MYTLGAILGPATAFLLLPVLNHNYRKLFALTLIPGIAAALAMAFLVREKERKRVAHVSFGQSLRSLPGRFKGMLAAVGLFGAGDFAHSLLILLATQKLTPSLGAAGAAGAATGFYLLHNVFYAGSAPVTGWLADRFNKGRLLAVAYLLAAAMALAVMLLPLNVWTLALVFVTGGTYMGMVETLEDSFSAELVAEEQHGMAFGTLATVNGVGDFLSSVIVGLLWSAFGTTAAFTYSAFLFFAGAGLVMKTAGRKK